MAKAKRCPIICGDCRRLFWCSPRHHKICNICCYCSSINISDEQSARGKGVTRNSKRVFKLWQKQDGLCYYCKKPTKLQNDKTGRQADDTATLDHYIPRTRLFVMACHKCNNKKGRSLLHPITGERLPNELLL